MGGGVIPLMDTKITAAFKAALEESLAALPQPTSSPVSFDDFVRCLGPEAAAQSRAIDEDVLEVIRAIQGWRDTDPNLDAWFRERGIVTRVREVR